MPTIAVIGSGLEEVAASSLDGYLFRSSAFEMDPRLAGLVNSSLAEYNDLPPNVSRLVEVLKDDMSDAKTVAKAVELNPALAAKVLKLVNASFAGLRGKVSSLKRAVTLLGFNHIRSLLLGTSVFMRHRHHKLPSSLPLGELWKHSVAVSQIAGAIGDAVGSLDSATLVSGGILHDAGMLVMASVNPMKFASCISASIDDGQNIYESELSSIGIVHPILSGALGRMWNLPQRLVDLMMFYAHTDLAPDKRMAIVLNLAEYLARSNEMGFDGQHGNGSAVDVAAEALGITPERVVRLIEKDKMDEIAENIRLMSDWE